MAKKFFNSVQRSPERLAWEAEWERKYRAAQYPPEYAQLIQELLDMGYKPEYRVVYDKAGSFHQVDFANPELKHAVEFDGPSHKNKSRIRIDAMRDRHLKHKGWETTRIVCAKSVKR